MCGLYFCPFVFPAADYRATPDSQWQSSAPGNPCVVVFYSYRTLPSTRATRHTTGTRSHIPQDTMPTPIRLDQTSSLRIIHRYSSWADVTQACESHVWTGSKPANYP